MSNPLDPTVLHAAECSRCGYTYRDGDILDDNQHCPSCQEELAELSQEDEDEA